MLARVRAYFAAQNVLEVDVPTVLPNAIAEEHITHLMAPSTAGMLYLQASPESSMKRLLASDYPDIFTVAKAFRNGEIGRRHAIEFTLLEWYRRDFGLQDIISDTVHLIASALDRPALADADVVAYRDAFTNAGLDVDAPAESLANKVGDDPDLRQTIGNDIDTWRDLAIGTQVAPSFAKDKLTVLYHYPASQAALARLSPDNPEVADRFEVFLGETELANGYVELTDAGEQLQRLEVAAETRRARGEDAPPPDELLLAALESGLPPCAGVALGIDRLHLILEGSDTINDVQTIAIRKPHE